MSITVTSANVRPANAHQCVMRNFYTGGAVTVGYCPYIDASGYIQHADADAGETESRGIGIIVGSPDGETSIAASRYASVCVYGPVYGFSDMTPGAPVYVDTTAGLLTQTAPTGGAYQRVVGWALDATTLWVSPDSEEPDSV